MQTKEAKQWVRVRARAKRGFWRAGMFWPCSYVYRELSAADAAIVLAETQLDAHTCDGPPVGDPSAPEPAPQATTYQTLGDPPKGDADDEEPDGVPLPMIDSPSGETPEGAKARRPKGR